MGAIVLLGAGLAALLVGLSRRGVATAKGQESSTAGSAPGSLPGLPAGGASGAVGSTRTASQVRGDEIAVAGTGTVAAVATAAGASAPVAAVGAAWVAANALVGGRITGDVGGTIAGGVLGAQGNAGNVGRVIGAQIDKALGGTGRDISGTVAQGAGFAVLTIAAYFGWLVGIQFAVLASLVYLTVVVIDDLVRLGKGQKGAHDDYWRFWALCETKAFQQFQTLGTDPVTGTPFTSAEQIARYSWAVADGYAREHNRQRFREWMHRPKGATLTWAEHSKWGSDRAYFAGSGGDSLGVDAAPYGEPGLRMWTAEYADRLASADGVTGFVPVSYTTSLPRYAYRYTEGHQPVPEWFWRVIEHQYPQWEMDRDPSSAMPLRMRLDAVPLGTITFPSNMLSNPSGFGLYDFRRNFTLIEPAEMVPVQRTGFTDEFGETLREAGELLAIFEAWQKWWNEPRDVTVSFGDDLAHAELGARQGRYQGFPYKLPYACAYVDGSGTADRGRVVLWVKGVAILPDGSRIDFRPDDAPVIDVATVAEVATTARAERVR